MKQNDKIGLTEKEVMRAFDIAKVKMQEAEKEVRKYAKKDPSKAITIAAGVGAAIGAILMLAVEKEEGRKKERPWEKRIHAKSRKKNNSY